MNIGKLILLLITIALGAPSAAAQGDGSLTFTDHLNQSVTINRLGAVLKLKTSNGKETLPNNIYRVCPCGESGLCIESAIIPSKETQLQFEVVFPRKGTTLKKGETLVVAATFRQAEFWVKRYLRWEAGFSSVEFDEAIHASRSSCGCKVEAKLEKISFLQYGKMCPRPPGERDSNWVTCPPETNTLMVMHVSSTLTF